MSRELTAPVPAVPRLRRVGRFAPLALGLALTVSGAVLVGTGSAGAAPVEVSPLGGSRGFLVLVGGDAQLNNTAAEGPVAVGGDLAGSGAYRIATERAGEYRVDDADAEPTSLVVGGRFAFDRSGQNGQALVAQGHAAVGRATGTVIEGAEGTRLVPPGGSYLSRPQLAVAAAQPGPSLTRAGFRVDRVFAELRERSAALATCAQSVTVTRTGAQVALGLVEGATNVWTVSPTEVNAINQLTVTPRPRGTTRLVINLTGGGLLRGPGTSNLADADGARVLWNHSGTAALQLTNVATLPGTIFAPSARVLDTDRGDLAGGVVAQQFTHGVGTGSGNGGVIRDRRFTGALACDTEPPTPTSSPSESSSSSESSSESSTPPVTTTTDSTEPTTTTTEPTTTEPSTTTTTEPTTTTTEPTTTTPSESSSEPPTTTTTTDSSEPTTTTTEPTTTTTEPTTTTPSESSSQPSTTTTAPGPTESSDSSEPQPTEPPTATTQPSESSTEPPPGVPGPGAGQGPGDDLAFTGAPVGSAMVAAGSLITLGGALLLLTGRRRDDAQA